MRKILVSVVLALVLVTSVSVPAFAASSDTVGVTATPIFLTIEILPATEALGNLAENSTNWAYAAGPTFPIEDTTATFTVTNNSSVAVDLGIKATDFPEGVGWTLITGDPTDINNQVRMRAGFEGETEIQMQVVTTSDTPFITSLGIGADIDWEFCLDTGLFTDGVAKSTTITLQATAS